MARKEAAHSTFRRLNRAKRIFGLLTGWRTKGRSVLVSDFSSARRIVLLEKKASVREEHLSHAPGKVFFWPIDRMSPLGPAPAAPAAGDVQRH